MNTVLTQEQIELINSMSKEQLQEAGIKLSTKQEKSPEDKLKTEQNEAFWSCMESVGAMMKNGSWICMCNEHMNKDGVRPATYWDLPMVRHIIKTGCKETRYVSRELFVKHGLDMFTRKHVTMKYATENIERLTQEKKVRDVEKAQKDLAKAQAELAK